MRLISKVLTSVILVLSNCSAYGNCNLKEDISRSQDGTFSYTSECHRLVGKTFKDKKDLQEQVQRYENLLPLYEERVELEKLRAESWKSTSKDLEHRFHNLEWINDKNKFIYFGAGVLVTLSSAWAVKQVSK